MEMSIFPKKFSGDQENILNFVFCIQNTFFNIVLYLWIKHAVMPNWGHSWYVWEFHICANCVIIIIIFWDLPILDLEPTFILPFYKQFFK